MSYATALAYPGRVFTTANWPEKPISSTAPRAASLLMPVTFSLAGGRLLGNTYLYVPSGKAVLTTFNTFKSRDKVACVTLMPSAFKACCKASWLLIIWAFKMELIIFNLFCLIFTVGIIINFGRKITYIFCINKNIGNKSLYFMQKITC